MTEPLSREMLDEAMRKISERGMEPRHVCSLDGHIAHFCSTRCAYCHEHIRELSPNEKRIFLGEF